MEQSGHNHRQGLRLRGCPLGRRVGDRGPASLAHPDHPQPLLYCLLYRGGHRDGGILREKGYVGGLRAYSGGYLPHFRAPEQPSHRALQAAWRKASPLRIQARGYLLPTLPRVRRPSGHRPLPLEPGRGHYFPSRVLEENGSFATGLGRRFSVRPGGGTGE